MNIVVSPDSFKGSMSSTNVGTIIKGEWQKVHPNDSVTVLPLADGGEGTSEIISQHLNAKQVMIDTVDPLDRPITASFYIYEKTAFIELAAASGLILLNDNERNPYIASTYGSGLLISAALDLNISKIVLGLGGVATNDAGKGLLSALGVKFLDTHNMPLAPGGQSLGDIAHVDMSGLDQRLANIEIVLATDVTNTFIGENGATYTFGPQKCASKNSSEAFLEALENSLLRFQAHVQSQFNLDLNSFIGGGAAGGTGATLQALLGARYQSGIDLVLSIYNFGNILDETDLVITGEGQLDAQSIQGKTISGVLALAKKREVPVIAVVGSITCPLNEYYQAGLTAAFSIVPTPMTLESAVQLGPENLINCISNLARVVQRT